MEVLPRTHPLTLQFRDPALERAFHEDTLPAAMRQARRAFLIVTILHTINVLLYSKVLFNVLASWVARQAIPFGLDEVGYLISFMVLALLWAFYAFTSTRWFRRLFRPSLVAFCSLYMCLLLTSFLLRSAARAASYPAGGTELELLAQISALFYLVSTIILMGVAFVFIRGGFLVANLIALLAMAVLLSTIISVVRPPLAWGVNYSYHLFIAYVVAMLAGYVVETGLRRDFLLRRELAAEREKSERLLLNVLPASIAERLKRGEEPIADAYAEATILFADIVDFTGIASHVSPDQLVGLLNEVFTEFDLLAAKLGLEKIKTIGDAYMVVAGLPEHRSDHAEAAAEMALAMQDAVTHKRAPTGEPLGLRIGINTGPVVAGVIGTAKFAYDLWGDTVNTSSRMESHGVPNAIQVTAATYERLHDKYEFQSRGTVDVKGKGPLHAYLLLGRREEPEMGAVTAVARA